MQTWTSEGVESSLELVYHDRGLYAGEKPDYHGYIKKIGGTIKAGSMVMGHRHAWMRKMAEKENEIYRRVWGRGGYEWTRSYHTLFRPEGNPGPDLIAKVEKLRKRGGVVQAKFSWMRSDMRNAKRSWRNTTEYPDKQDTFWCAVNDLIHVDAYQPGDFRKFFSDPRTRQEYLEWANELLTCEEWHAGNINSRGKWKQGAKRSRHCWRIAGSGSDAKHHWVYIDFESGTQIKVKYKDTKTNSRSKWVKTFFDESSDVDGNAVWLTSRFPKWLATKLKNQDYITIDE